MTTNSFTTSSHFSQKDHSVSVVIITHNRKKRLKQCVNSILHNSKTPQEIIIVDDGDKKKDCKKLINKFSNSHSKVLFKYERIYPSKNVSYSRNRGVKLSTGRIIAFIDDDCNANADWIEKMEKSHKTYRDYPAITGLVLPRFVHNYWNQVLFLFHKNHSIEPDTTDFLYGANCSFKREVFFNYKVCFNEKMPICSEDRYISYELINKGHKLLYDPSIIVKHDFRTNLTSTFKQWFRYGRSDYFFWKLTPNYNNGEANYLKNISTFNAFIQSFFRIPLKIYTYVKDIAKNNKLNFIPGLIIIFTAYFLGAYKEFYSDRLFKTHYVQKS